MKAKEQSYFRHVFPEATCTDSDNVKDDDEFAEEADNDGTQGSAVDNDIDVSKMTKTLQKKLTRSF